jgi:uncharacterized membrane protein
VSRYQRACAVLFALALLLRLPGLGDSFYGDEGFSVLRDSERLLTDSEDRFRPVFFSLLYLWRQLGFHGEIGLRSLPLIFGMAQIPLVFVVGKRLGGERLALVWGALLATSPLLVEFSQELRMYSLVALVALAQAWALLRVREQPSLGRWAAFAAIGLFGAYTHLHYWLFLAGCGAWLLWEHKAVRLWQTIAAFGAVVVFYLPNIPNLIEFSHVRGGKYVVALASAVPKLIAALLVGFNYFTLGETGDTRALGARDFAVNLPLIVLAAVPLALVAYSLVRAHLRRPIPETILLCHALATIPIILASALTVVTKQYWLHPKYVIYVAPFVLLFVAEGWVLLERAPLRVAAALSSVVVVAVALSRFWRPREFGRREDWRAAAEVLKKETADPNVALVMLRHPYGLLQYYWPDAREHWNLIEPPALQTDQAGLDAIAASITKAAEGKKKVVYLRWDTIQNDLDPGDLVVKDASKVGDAEPPQELNPRLFVDAWDVHPSSAH